MGRLHHHHRDDLAAEPTGGTERAVALAVVCMCALVAGIDMTITNVALPFIARAFDAPTSELQWTIDAYNILFAGFLVLGGALADRIGRKRVFLASFVLFGLGSGIAAAAGSVEVLIGARALMGLGAAGFTAPALAIIASMYAPEERGRAISVFVIFGAAGLSIGPTVGGVLLDSFWWGSVFLVNVPLLALGVVLGARTLTESEAPTPEGGWPRLDVVGAVMSAVGLSALLFGVIEGPGRGWTEPAVLAGLALGAAVLVGFVRRELTARTPLFDVRILARPVVASGAITLFMAYVLFNTFMFLTPQYLQDVREESIVTVGLLFLPFTIAFAIASRRAGPTLEALGPRRTIPLGLVVAAVGTLLLAVAMSHPVWATAGASMLFGVGLSLLIAPPSTVVMNDLPAAKAGDGSSLNFVSRATGAALGVAVIGSILASGYAGGLGDVTDGLSSTQVEAVDGSIQGALETAAELPSSSGAALTAAAQDAFVSGARTAFLTSAGLALVAAVVAWVALGREAADG